MTKRVFHLLLLLFLLADLGYSFWQHYNVALDGDMANIILPSPAFQQVLHDPFGLQVFLTGESYAATNRFFAHWWMSTYFKTIPQALQVVVNPIESIYLACAIFKTAVQFFILFLLAKYVTASLAQPKIRLLPAIVLISPLFQTFGYNKYMGIIDQYITYTFFYAFPLGLLLLFFYPFFKAIYQGQAFHWSVGRTILFLGLTIMLPFSGSLVPGLVLFLSACFFITNWWKQFKLLLSSSYLRQGWIALKSIPFIYFTYLLPINVLCLYSLYIGQYNIENFHATIPIAERYARMPIGLFGMLTNKIGLPLLIVMTVLNYQFIKQQAHVPQQKKLLMVYQWVAVVAFLYLLILPLGGYREYRYYVVRYDTIMPIVLGLMYLYGAAAYFLLNQFKERTQKLYLAGTILFLLVFIIGDGPHFEHNNCEKDALYTIAISSEKIVPLPNDCPVVGWEKKYLPEESDLNAQLLLLWGITGEKKLFYSAEHKE